MINAVIFRLPSKPSSESALMLAEGGFDGSRNIRAFIILTCFV